MALRNVVLALLLGCTGLSAQTPTSSELVLRPGDAVRLQVGTRGWWIRDAGPGEGREPELSNDFPVLESGEALLPIIGVVEVAGRPFGEIRSEIRERYARELVDAPVMVAPILRIAVLGEVQQPGLVPVDPTLTIADVVAATGGLTPRGDPGKVMLLRDQVTTRISLAEAEGGGGRRLEPGDQILVGRQSWIRENLNVLLPSAASVLAATITTLILRSR